MTREDVLARRERRGEILAQIERLQTQIQDIDRWLEAVALIAPDDFLADVLPPNPSSKENADRASVWRQAVEDALGVAERGMLPRDLAAYIRDHGSVEAREKINRNPNGLYNMLARMLDEGLAAKVGDKFYSPALLSKLTESGEINEDAYSDSATGTKAIFIKAFEHHGMMSPKSLMEILRSDPEVGPKLKANPQYGYSTLARLVRQGLLIKEGSIYKLPLKENEPSSVGSLDGSDAELEEEESGLPAFLR
ncbi:hypothetical protein U8607_21460 [Methylobacterium durans]|uniref:hypothetical protein n=1 Tax=Methylobacterium durans TaxID=2202825 RepID=UPI002AFDDFE8|nr:hypothetical protein [Methylobacterium durans]MEA1834665.1 hypothetical protein [Methylobacterium durans]